MIITFKGMPPNYHVIDRTVTRSAQPAQNDFRWLKKEGVTDIINFRTLYKPAINFDEQKLVESLGMKYHSIPSITNNPSENNVNTFLDLINNIKKSGGKAHIHCMAGADRTGMYSLIYKQVNNIDDFVSNKAEMLKFGHNAARHPDLLGWIENFLKSIKAL